MPEDARRRKQKPRRRLASLLAASRSGGDAFDAGFITALHRKMDLETALRFAQGSGAGGKRPGRRHTLARA
jgi:hypothetical protein